MAVTGTTFSHAKQVPTFRARIVAAAALAATLIVASLAASAFAPAWSLPASEASGQASSIYMQRDNYRQAELGAPAPVSDYMRRDNYREADAAAKSRLDYGRGGSRVRAGDRQ